VAGDFTGDGLPDVIACSGGKTRLFVAPKWKEILLAETPGKNFIHSESKQLPNPSKCYSSLSGFTIGLPSWSGPRSYGPVALRRGFKTWKRDLTRPDL
jgi:hypothetical protein